MTALADLDSKPAEIKTGARLVSNYDLPRPFYFMVPFWGERYRQYFVNRLLPSLLAPNNLALLRADQGHRFLIATTAEDFAAIKDLPIMGRLGEYATPTLIEIPKPEHATAPGSTNAVIYQDFARKLLVNAAFEAKAYGCVICPDSVISDGMMLSLLRHARSGCQLVMCTALRQSEESILSELRTRGYLPDGSEPGETGAAINIPQRALADLMVRHLHPEMAKFEAGAAGQPLLAPFLYWRLPNNEGIILHAFHGSPVLMDYGAVDSHDVACFDHGSFEEIYVARNFAVKGKTHIVGDSDEFCIMSLTPSAVAQMPSVTSAPTENDDGGLARCYTIAASISFHARRMPLKQRLFQQSVCWHGRELGMMAVQREARISTLIDRAASYSRHMQPIGLMLETYLKSPSLARSVPYLRRMARGVIDPRGREYIRQRISFAIFAPFKRALFWLGSGKYLDRFDPLHLSFRRTSGRRPVSSAQFAPDPTTAVILGVGQSNIANECDPHALFKPKGDVFNFNFFDGKCYEASDPLLGASIDRSNPLTRLGDLLIEHGNYRRVLLVPIAHGGTYANEWSPGGRMFPRLEWTLEQLKERGITITHIAWQQGESEAAQHDAKPEDWVSHFTATVGAIRAAGVDAPIYVAQCTICRSDPDERIRAAQRQVVNPATGILPGPDLDVVGQDERYDGCHFSAAGLKRAAALWHEALCPAN